MNVAVMRTLSDIGRDVDREFQLAQTDAFNAARHARKCGEFLLEAKGRCEHGEWLPWLEANFPHSERTAQAWMQITANPQTSADSSINGALKAIAAANQPVRQPDDTPSTSETRKMLQAVSTQDGDLVIDADVVDEDTDPRISRVIDALAKAVGLFGESLALNPESGKSSRILAAREARSMLNRFIDEPV